MQIYFHSCLCSYLPRVPILVEDTVYFILFKLTFILFQMTKIYIFFRLLVLVNYNNPGSKSG